MGYGLWTSGNMHGGIRSQYFRRKSQNTVWKEKMRTTYGQQAETDNTALHLQQGAEGGLH